MFADSPVAATLPAMPLPVKQHWRKQTKNQKDTQIMRNLPIHFHSTCKVCCFSGLCVSSVVCILRFVFGVVVLLLVAGVCVPIGIWILSAPFATTRINSPASAARERKGHREGGKEGDRKGMVRHSRTHIHVTHTNKLISHI